MSTLIPRTSIYMFCFTHLSTNKNQNALKNQKLCKNCTFLFAPFCGKKNNILSSEVDPDWLCADPDPQNLINVDPNPVPYPDPGQ